MFSLPYTQYRQQDRLGADSSDTRVQLVSRIYMYLPKGAVIVKVDIQGSERTTRGFNCLNPHAVITLPVVHNTIEYMLFFMLSWCQRVAITQAFY